MKGTSCSACCVVWGCTSILTVIRAFMWIKYTAYFTESSTVLLNSMARHLQRRILYLDCLGGVVKPWFGPWNVSRVGQTPRARLKQKKLISLSIVDLERQTTESMSLSSWCSTRGRCPRERTTHARVWHLKTPDQWQVQWPRAAPRGVGARHWSTPRDTTWRTVLNWSEHLVKERMERWNWHVKNPLENR